MSWEDELPDEQPIMFDEMAKIMVPFYRALTSRGLSGQEAAALTAAYFHQVVPQALQGPQDGS